MSPSYRTKYKRLKLPDHVGVQKKQNTSGQTVLYFYYILPDGSKEPLGKDLEEVKAIAAALNLKLYSSEGSIENLVGRVKKTSMNPHVSDVVDEFTEDWLSKQGYSERSYKERVIKLRQYGKEWPMTPIQDLKTYELAQFLKPLSNETTRQHKFLLVQFFNFAKSEGYYLEENPALSILRVKSEKRKRFRHTWEGFKKVRETAPSWLGNAMDSAFYTLQRRSDLVALRKPDHINIDSGIITVQQSKSDSYENPVLIEISMGKELTEVVKQSFASGIPCPYLVHCRPKRITASDRKKKPHPFAVMPDYLTRAYSKARDESGAYDQIENRKLRPSFHDIRALGIWAYFKAGYATDYIQALAGHADEAMTLRYEAGHEKPKPLHVEAGLSLAAVDFRDVDWQTELPKELSDLVDSDDAN